MVVIRNAPRFSAAFASVALASAFVLSAARAADAPAVPVDVRVPVVLTTPITSQTAHVGDSFGFKTTKDETLGALAVPAGTPGTGRLAVVQAAHDKQHGNLSLQADKLLVATGETVWVNIDPSRAPMGHLADKKTRFYVLPLPIGIVPGTYTSVSGNMILDAGTPFRVVTIRPRTSPAPLITAVPTAPPSPTPAPSSVPTVAPTPAPSAAAT